MNGWNFSKLSTAKYERTRHEISEEFKDITFVGDTADVSFVLSEDGKTRVTCYEETKAKHSVSVQEGVLTICLEDTKKWYDYIGINCGAPKITVEIPAGEYGVFSLQASTGDVDISAAFSFESMDISLSTGDVTSGASAKGKVKIKVSTGNVSVSSISADTVELTASTGKVEVNDLACTGDVRIKVTTGKTMLQNVECKNLTSTGNTGDIFLQNVIAAEKFSLERTTGRVEFDRYDAAELSVKTSTGKVSGSLLSGKVFVCQTSTGDVDVPQSATGGKCEINTSTGDIKITVE